MSTEQDTVRQRVIKFYEKYNPQKSLRAIERILQAYQGREDKLFEILELQYITLPSQGIQRHHEQTLVMLSDTTNAERCRIKSHIHLSTSQCNLLLYGYIRHSTKLFIADDIYTLCWQIFLDLNKLNKTKYETGELYQGYECQIYKKNDWKCHESNDLIYLRFVYKNEANENVLNEDKWIVRDEQKGKYDHIFYSWSLSRARASGSQVANYALSQSGLIDTTLSKIWDICDFECSGSLTHDQFCLFMYIVDKVKETGEIPKITEELIPPNNGWRDIWRKYPINELNLRLYYYDSEGEIMKAGGTYKGIQKEETFTQQTHTMHPYQIWNGDYLLGVYMPTSAHPHHLITLKKDEGPEGAIICSCSKGSV